MKLSTISQKIKNSLTFFQRRKTIIFIILILGIVIIGLIWQFAAKEKEGEIAVELVDKDAILFEGAPSVIFELGQTAKLGVLEIDAYNIKESSYLALELDENYQRITKRYLTVPIKVFNPSFDTTENLLIGLIDDKGNKYRPNFSIAHDIPELKDFTRNMMIFPRIIQEGYIFFTDVNKEAKKLQLIFALESTKEKIAFEFER